MTIKMSEQTKELFTAMSAFQKDVKQPKKDANNPFFKSKYVPLENVVDAIHTIGSQHGLSEMTYPAVSENGTEFGVGVIITHSSGQFIQFPPITLKPEKNTPQGVGSAMTYARRYALSSAFGIASETDDDANDISGNGSNKPDAKPKYINSKPEEKPKTATDGEVKILNVLITKLAPKVGKTEEETKQIMLDSKGIKESDLAKLNKDQYGLLLNALRELNEKYEKQAKDSKKTKVEEAPQQEEQQTMLDRYGNPN